MNEEKQTDCIFCKEKSKVGVRGNLLKDYVKCCPFHAGMLQMVFEKLGVNDSVKWKHLYFPKLYN